MSLFDWLLVGHLTGDFLLQTAGMAQYKEHDWSWMLRHVAVYVVVVAISMAIYALSHPISLWLAVAALLFIGGTHGLLDRRSLIRRWMRVVGVPVDHAWLFLVMDQVLHVLVLAVAAQILTTVGG